MNFQSKNCAKNFEMVLKKYTPMIYKIMAQLHIRQNTEDFFSEGICALYEAYLKYEKEKGDFSPYAYANIRGRLLNLIQKEERMMPKEKITVDHMFPQDFGGPTITNNLIPACKACNNEKNNMTKNEYLAFLTAKKHGKGKEFRREFNKNMKYGQYKIPKSWLTKRSITEITATFDLKENYSKGKLRTIKYFYNTYGILKKPIVVDKNGFLLDGFMLLMFAKTKGIKEIPVIVLDNVEVI